MVVENQEIEIRRTGSETESRGVAASERAKGNLLFGGVVLFTVLALAGAGYYLLHQLRTEQQAFDKELDKGGHSLIELTKQMTSFQSQLATLQSHMATVEQTLATQDNQFERTISEFSDRHNEKLDHVKRGIEEDIQRIQRQLGKTRGDWLMADAEYLLSVANERLYLVGDVKSSMLALEAADQRLRESGDPAAFEVREALVNEMNALKGVELPDIIGISARLRALQERVPEIPLFLPYIGQVDEKKSNMAKKSVEPKSGEWENFIDSALQDFKGLVTVKRNDRPVDFVLRDEEAQLLRENLRLKLEMSRIALIQRNQALFRGNLLAALDWISKHFDQDAEGTIKFMNEIKDLSNLTINLKLPDIGKSLGLLRNITKLRIETDKGLKPAGKSEES